MKTLYENYKTLQVTVGTAKTKIFSAMPGADSVTIQTLGTTQVTIINVQDTDATQGFPIPPTANSSVTLPANVDIYAIATGSTQAVAIIVSY